MARLVVILIVWVGLISSAFAQVPTTLTGNETWTCSVSGLQGPSTYCSSSAIRSFSSPAGWFNVNATNLTHWRTALATVRAGTGRARLMLVGDSTTMGAGSGSGGTGNLNGAFAKSWPNALAKILNTSITTSFNSLWSDQTSQVAYGTYDTRAVLGANWSLGTSALFAYTTGVANNLSFTPPGQIDTVIVYMVQNGGTGTATFNVDGGASLGTITSAGVTSIVPYQVSVTKGSHTINIVPNNNGNFFIQGIVAYDSTTPAVDIIQDGQYGSTTSSWTSTGSPWNPGAHFASVQPNLSIICLTINDSNASVPINTYITNMQTIITNALAQGDVILMVGPPSNTIQATNGTLTQYINALRSLATSNNIPLFDLSVRWVNYSTTNVLMPYFDTLHPGILGYQDMALGVSEMISNP